MKPRTIVRGAWEVLRALGPMAFIEIALRSLDLPTTCRRLGVGYDPSGSQPPAPALAVLPRRTRITVMAVLAVAAHWPPGDTCLRRCLLLGHRLRELDPVLRIGVRRGPDGEFSAHSWLEFDGCTLDPVAFGFAPLGSAGRSA